MNTAAAIETVGLGRRYGSRWALRDCTFSLPAGHVIGLVGPNGAGKSTLLRMTAGLLRPTAGSLHVLGQSPADPAVLPRMGSSPRTSRCTAGSRWPTRSGWAAG